MSGLSKVESREKKKHIQSVPAKEEKMASKENIYAKYGRYHGQEKWKKMRKKKNISFTWDWQWGRNATEGTWASQAGAEVFAVLTDQK